VRDFDYTPATDFLESFFHGAEHAIEIRALSNSGGAKPLLGGTPDLIRAHCSTWDKPGWGVFFGCCTRIRGRPTGSRADLAELVALHVDIDAYKHGFSKEEIVAALKSCPIPPTVIVDSGGGIHAYWLLREPLDVRLPADGPDTIKEDVDAVLRQLAGVFAGDPAVCEIARVMRLVGTHNTKDGTLRPVVLLDASGPRYELSDLQATLDWLGPVLRAPEATDAASEPVETNPYLEAAKRYAFKPSIDVEQRLATMAYQAEGPASVNATQRDVSASMVSKGHGDEEILELLLTETRRAAWPHGERWNWKREETKIQRLISDWREKLAKIEASKPPPPPAPVRQLRGGSARPAEDPDGDASPEDVPKLSGYPLNDLGNAMRLILQHGTALRYVVGMGWHAWDKRRYCFDPAMVACRRLAHETARTMLLQAFDEPGRTKVLADRKKALVKFAVSSGDSKRISNMLSQAEPHLDVTADDLDRDPWALNCLSGTVDVRTGELRPHNQGDLLTKLIPVQYDPTAACPTWLRFLDEIFAGDDAMVAFVQRALGYTISGSTREQVIFILHGGGANGKSVLLEVIAALLADYASHCPSDTFTSNEIGGSGIPNDVARLAGARFVSIVETEHDKKLAEGLVKQATGGDRLTARFMRQEFFEFTPRFKIWLATNHKPRIRGTDNAIWRRIRLLPFNVTFVDREDAKAGQPIKDPDLKDKLLAELPGILNWAIEGCMAWLAEGGLKPPVAVNEATKEYRESQDIVAGFIDDRCNVDPGIECASGELYDAYKKWCTENGERTIPSSEFNASLTEKGYIPRKGTGGRRMRNGLNLRPIFDGQEA
jgi:P4 family phage/plasmid primase-like protien